jgi:glycogen phosphorylase
MKNIHVFNVAPSLPPKLRFLETLSANLWWCWNRGAIDLFRRMDPDLWIRSRHNPFAFFELLPQKRIEALSADDGFLTHLRNVEKRFRAEVLDGAEGNAPTPSRTSDAYFSLEFGIHESVRLYAGGLGCLAGDHLKSASDLGLPLVGVGLLYRQGYFQQYLNDDGWQQEAYPENLVHLMPIRKECNAEGQDIQITVPLADGTLTAGIWRLDVGRIALYLLDANIPANPPALRRVTTQLYPGDRELRLRQELLLGIGGYRALLALGFDPPVCHINEGHAAFLALARIAHLVKDRGVSPEAAREIVPRSSVFTTHTPVPAGNESFPVDLLRSHLPAIEKEMGIDPNDVIRWGQAPDGNGNGEILMTVLGLRMAVYSNGVSRLHGTVAREMWSHLWPRLPVDEVPIGHITNGVHVPSWLSADNALLFDRYLGEEWRGNPGDTTILERVDNIPDEELWRAHEIGKARLIRAARARGERQYSARNASEAELATIRSVLKYDSLTIGFARRFAAYKRATLLLRDPQRLIAMLTDKEQPVQIVFAGKAHPSDNAGKDLIRQIVHFAQQAGVRDSIIFLEDYDIQLARYLVQGVDVWLNTPRRPEEASGTSGMKAAVNGALHLSTLDGWWDEGYSPDCGWAIGQGEQYESHEYQEQVEAQALYNLLENEIIPCFYDRADGRVPLRWVGMMKASMRNVLTHFTTHRMVADYGARYYTPARAAYEQLLADGGRAADALVKQHQRLSALWGGVVVVSCGPDRDINELHVGDRFTVSAVVRLGELTPEDVDVQLYHGRVDADNRILQSCAETMTLQESGAKGEHVYRQELSCGASGRYGLTVRVIPRGTDWNHAMPGYMTWSNGAD